MDWLMRVSRALRGKGTPPAGVDTGLFGTIIVVRLGDGSERQYRYETVMTYREAQDVLDPILDDMDGGAIRSPVHIVRYHRSGHSTTEEVIIYSSEGFEVL